ncbi:MAG: HIT domain-containing protein [Minisyncoccia bacterium]
MAKVKLDNSRHPEQRERMEELVRTGQCHFCRKGFEDRHKAPIIHETDHWFVTANNFPYQGSVHHHLIVPKIHITRLRELGNEARIQLFDVQAWLEDYLGTTGSSTFVRSGDMDLTCATLDHLHFHLIVGERKVGDSPNQLEDLILVPVGYKKK